MISTWDLNDILIASLHLELNDTETENLSNEEQQINKPAFAQAVAQVRESFMLIFTVLPYSPSFPI